MAPTDYMAELPVELLGEIFTHCSSHSPDSPLVLRSVSRSFHDAIENTPQLWTNVSVSTADDELSARKALLWFSKAGTCSLSIFVEVVGGGDSAVVESPQRLSTTLARYRARIASLKIRAQTEEQVSSLLFSVYASPGPSLYPPATPVPLSLDVQIDSDYTALHPLLLIPPAVIPPLHSFILVTPTLPNLDNVSFAHLTSLKITRPIRARPIPMETIFGILSSSTSLREFHLETRLDLEQAAPSFPVSPHDTQSELINLPELTCLSLRTNNNPRLLSILVLPDLRTLKLNALDGRRRGRAQETASAFQRLLLRMEEPIGHLSCHSTSGSSSDEDKGIEVLELAGVGITRPLQPGTRNEIWEWCFKNMRSLRRLTARNMDTEHLVELLSQGMRRAWAPSYLGLGHGTEGAVDASAGSQFNNAMCPKLEYFAVPAPDASPAMKVFKLARPFVKVRTFGNGFGYWDGAISSSEDALRPRKVQFSSPVVARTVVLGEVKEQPAETSTAGGTSATPSGNSDEQAAKGSETEDVVPAPAMPPCAVVGGFGFGSQFARTRPTPLHGPSSPRPTTRKVHGNDVLF